MCNHPESRISNLDVVSIAKHNYVPGGGERKDRLQLRNISLAEAPFVSILLMASLYTER